MKIRKLWFALTKSASVDPEQNYRESITRISLFLLALASIFLNLYICRSLISRSLIDHQLIFVLSLDFGFSLAILLYHHREWIWCSRILVLIFFLAGCYSIFFDLYPMPGILAFVVAILLAGALSSPLFLSIIILASASLDSIHLSILNQQSFKSLFTFGVYIGIGLLQRMGISRFQKAAARSTEIAQQLRNSIWLHHQAQIAQFKKNQDQNHLPQDLFRLTKNTEGEIVIQLFENQIVNRMMNCTCDPVGQLLSSILPLTTDPEIHAIIERAFSGDQMNYTGKFDDSCFTMILTPVFQAGTVIEVAGSLFDTPQNEKEDSELQVFQKEMRYFIDHTPIGMIEMNPQGIITSWNEAACKIFGYREEEIIGQKASQKLIPIQQRKMNDNLFLSIMKDDQHDRIVTDNLTKAGLQIKCEWLNTILVDDKENATGMISVIQEVTDRVQAATLQRALYQISEAANRTKNLSELYRSVHQIIGELVSVRNFYIALYAPDRQSINYVYFVDEIDQNPGNRKLSKGLTEFVLQTGEPALVDPERFDELVAQGVVENFGTPSVDWLGVPLKDQDQHTFGVVVIQTYTEGERYNRNHLNILNFVSIQIAIAILRKQAASKLIESEEKYRNFLEQTNDAMLLLDEHGRIIEVNRSLERMTGYDRDELEGKTLWEMDYLIMPPEMKEHTTLDEVAYRYKKNIFNKVKSDMNLVFDFEVYRKDHTRRFAQQAMFSIKTGQSYHIGVITRDITDQKRVEEELRQSEERYRSFMENQGEGSIYMDLDETFIYTNPAADSLFGVEPGLLVGRNIREFLDEEQYKKVLEQTQIQTRGEKTSYELIIHRPDQTKRTLLITATPQISSDGKYLGTFNLFRDITERKIIEDRLRYYSMYDSLTNIHNRAFFDTEMNRLQTNLLYPVSIMIVDVDDLKRVNDLQGHAIGDEVLKRTASLLRSAIRSDDIVARIGGDEFAIIFPNTNSESVARMQKRIITSINTGNQESPTLPIYVSTGIATWVEGTDLSEMVRLADSRMFHDKAKKKKVNYWSR